MSSFYAGALRKCARRHGVYLEIQLSRWSARELKRHSYNGALRTQHGDPAHFYCSLRQRWYWNAGNRVYARLLRDPLHFLPRRLAAWLATLGHEKLGDVCEAILGMGLVR